MSQYVPIPPGTAVLVKWDDIRGEGAWTDRAKARKLKPVRVYTIGWVLLDTPKLLRVVSSRHHGKKGQVGDITTIPQGCVHSVVPL